VLTLALALTLVLAGCSKKDSSGGSAGGSSSGGSASAPKASGKAAPASDFSYDLTADGKGIKITGYTGKGGKVVIPATIEDMPVTEIGPKSEFGTGPFQGQTSRDYFPANEITELVIPDSVVSISSGMGGTFGSNDGLTKVQLPNGLKVIPAGAFFKCPNLTTVNLPTSLVEMGSQAFDGCGELNNLTIPDSLTSLDFETKSVYENGAFKGCGKLPIKTRQKLQELGYKESF
jgi:hypothetical protein